MTDESHSAEKLGTSLPFSFSLHKSGNALFPAYPYRHDELTLDAWKLMYRFCSCLLAFAQLSGRNFKGSCRVQPANATFVEGEVLLTKKASALFSISKDGMINMRRENSSKPCSFNLGDHKAVIMPDNLDPKIQKALRAVLANGPS